MSSRPRSLRWWLAGLVTAVALPVLLLLIAVSIAQVEREQAEARMSALRMAKASAARIRDSYTESLGLLEQMSRLPAIVARNADACRATFSAIDFFPRYADIFLFDPAGNVVCSGNTEPENDGISLQARQWITGALRAERLAMRVPQVRTFDGRSMAVLATRTRNGGTVVLLEFVEMIGRTGLFPSAVMTILDRRGTIIARSAGAEEWTGRNIHGTRIAELAQKYQEGVAEAKGVEGITRQYGFARLPEFGWYVYVGVPNSTIVEPVREMLFNGAIGGVGILFVVTVMTLVVARKITRPIHALVSAATTTDEGSYIRVSGVTGPLELANLAGAFNRMIDRRQDTDQQTRMSERKMKALHERLLHVQEEERRRIARELHDDLGQSLTALKMDFLGLLKATAPHPSFDPISKRIVATLDSTVSAVQRISSELRPSVLDDLGLVAAIEEEARLFEARSGIECEVSVVGAVPEDSETVTAIYRIVQEALTNVARHSNATRTELRLRQRGDELLLEIRDDGRGVTPEEIGDPLSLGLVGIRERAALIGGTVEIEGVATRGTIVSARLPMSLKARLA
ncbi:MAG TPA: ATP-binding protein [Thermoanaerobaculia bacterium]|nr:ATP-binding protein [Thermoanaerobaculia bacterium]